MGIIGIVIGAFAAHGLKPLLSSENIQIFETGVRYQMYHALFLLVLSFINFLSPKKHRIICVLTIFGVLFFSGSIYGLATNSLTVFNFKTIGFITPIGGLLLISAWGVLLLEALKLKLN